MRSTGAKWIGWAVLIAGLVLYPRLLGIYYTNLFVTLAVFGLYSVSFNMLLGYTGLLSFGHALFFGAGGYGAALALKHLTGISLLTAVGIGLLAAVVLALLLCPLVVRISGTAFCMLHLAFGQLMHMLALKLRNITGGEDGIGGFPLPAVLSFDMKVPSNFYYFAMAVLGLSLWLMWFFTKTPFGQIQVGVRENAKRIDYLGFRITQTKAVVYVTAAAFAGVAGAIYALFQNLISADSGFHVMVSFAPVIMTMIGGIGSFFGPIWGAAIFQILEEVTSRFTDRVELVVGLILILTILFAPGGLAGLIQYVKQRWFAPKAGLEKAV